MDLLGFILLETLGFIDLDVCFLHQLGKFSAFISSSKFSATFSLYPLGTILYKYYSTCSMSLLSYLHFNFVFFCSFWGYFYFPIFQVPAFFFHFNQSAIKPPSCIFHCSHCTLQLCDLFGTSLFSNSSLKFSLCSSFFSQGH